MPNSNLSRILQHLNVPRKSWHIIVAPDPRKCKGFQRWDTGKYEFHVRLENNPDIDRYYSDNPTVCMAANSIPDAYKHRKPFSSTRDLENFYTQWVRIVEKTPESVVAPVPGGNPPRIWDIMTQIMERFPKYDLQTEQGVEKAIEDIEGALKPIATFELFEDQE
ncbi:hypothetical protein BDN72DRAFT_850303, partial [Pluteus cervinus]